jgi:hypothetical protein
MGLLHYTSAKAFLILRYYATAFNVPKHHRGFMKKNSKEKKIYF